jgi:hypothetical protein
VSIKDTGGTTNPKTLKGLQFFHNEAEYLRKFEDAVQRLSRSRHVKMKKPTKTRISEDCRQAIFSPNGIYCGLLKEQVDEETCRYCPLFDSEPQEYKLFIRI